MAPPVPEAASQLTVADAFPATTVPVTGALAAVEVTEGVTTLDRVDAGP